MTDNRTTPKKTLGKAAQAMSRATAKRTIPSGDVAAATSAQKLEFNARPAAPIVPKANIAGQSLTLLIAIMAFLASLTLGAVSLVDQSARTWQSQISREATIQIRPRDGLDMSAALEEARNIASGFAGVSNARIISEDETAQLLEPWLGAGLELDELPVPRLVIVTIDDERPPDFNALAAAVTNTIPDASVDDHRAWVDRLVSMARTTTVIGIAVLILMLGALALTVVFATRGALAGNHNVIEVLHFVGARGGFIATQFQTRFLFIGLRGAMIGGVLAMGAFFVTSSWAQRNLASIQGEQLSVLFGKFSIGPVAYAGVVLLVVIVGLLTALTTRYTVLATLHDIDERRADPTQAG